MPEGLSPALLAVLADAARLGFLGPGLVETGAEHALGFDRALGPADRILDLGSGGGLPGLVLAERRPSARFVLLDASQTRTDFLRRVVGRLGWGDRVDVVTGRAEALVRRDPRWRTSVDAVVARGFGSPALTAECASPFLVVGGELVVSEPPDDLDRWPAAGLVLLGLTVGSRPPGRFVRLVQRTPCPDRFPRRRLTPPLF